MGYRSQRSNGSEETVTTRDAGDMSSKRARLTKLRKSRSVPVRNTSRWCFLADKRISTARGGGWTWMVCYFSHHEISRKPTAERDFRKPNVIGSKKLFLFDMVLNRKKRIENDVTILIMNGEQWDIARSGPMAVRRP